MPSEHHNYSFEKNIENKENGSQEHESRESWEQSWRNLQRDGLISQTLARRVELERNLEMLLKVSSDDTFKNPKAQELHDAQLRKGLSEILKYKEVWQEGLGERLLKNHEFRNLTPEQREAKTRFADAILNLSYERVVAGIIENNTLFPGPYSGLIDDYKLDSIIRDRMVLRIVDGGWMKNPSGLYDSIEHLLFREFPDKDAIVDFHQNNRNKEPLVGFVDLEYLSAIRRILEDKEVAEFVLPYAETPEKFDERSLINYSYWENSLHMPEVFEGKFFGKRGVNKKDSALLDLDRKLMESAIEQIKGIIAKDLVKKKVELTALFQQLFTLNHEIGVLEQRTHIPPKSKLQKIFERFSPPKEEKNLTLHEDLETLMALKGKRDGLYDTIMSLNYAKIVPPKPSHELLDSIALQHSVMAK